MAHGTRTLAAALTALLMASGPAAATSITHFAETTSYGAPAPSCDDRNVNSGASSCATSWDSPFFWGGTTTVQDASFAGSASAALGDGALRATSSVENRQPSSGPVLALGERSHTNISQSIFGDTFSISVQDPNVAVSGAVATLKFDIEGKFAASGGVDLAATRDFFGTPQAYNAFEFSSALAVRQVGAFDLQQQMRELDPDDFASFDDYYAAFLSLNESLNATLIGQAGVGQHSNQAVLDSMFLSPGFEYSLGETGDVFASLTIDIPLLDPETIFEWQASLFTSVALDSSTLDAMLGADFGSTGILSVILPVGYALTSQSALFPASNVVVTTEVPEPASSALLVAGLAGLGLLRRRCAQAGDAQPRLA